MICCIWLLIHYIKNLGLFWIIIYYTIQDIVQNKYFVPALYCLSKLQNSNSISIHIRQNRFSDQRGLTKNKFFTSKSKSFTDESITYINKAINYFNNKIDNPKYFIWSNDHENINIFTKNLIISDFQLVQTKDVINDFFLFNLKSLTYFFAALIK